MVEFALGSLLGASIMVFVLSPGTISERALAAVCWPFAWAWPWHYH